MPSPANTDMPADVLLVEDDPIIALDADETMLALGVARVRTAARVSEALQMIDERQPDFALLDIGLRGETSFEVAERLAALGIPFAFATGYSNDLPIPRAFAQQPRLMKPCSADDLASVLKMSRR